MEDSSRCVYRIQIDRLILEAEVHVSHPGSRSDQRDAISLHFHTENSDGALKTNLSRGQLVATLQFFHAIWVQVGGQPNMRF